MYKPMEAARELIEIEDLQKQRARDAGLETAEQIEDYRRRYPLGSAAALGPQSSGPLDLPSRLELLNARIAIKRRELGLAMLSRTPVSALAGQRDELESLERARGDLQMMIEALPFLRLDVDRHETSAPHAPTYEHLKGRFLGNYETLRKTPAELMAAAEELMALALKKGPIFETDCRKFFSLFGGAPELGQKWPVRK